MQSQILDSNQHIMAGYFAVDITPRPGDYCSFRLAPNKRSLGIHDPLFAHALYLQNESDRLLLISIDACMIEEPAMAKIKSGISEKSDLSDAKILVSTTHTHNGAELFGEEPMVDNSAQLTRVIDGAISAALAAIQHAFSAQLGWGSIELPSFAKNRFQAYSGGNIDKVDDRLDFLRIDDAHGHFKGVLWHFAAHPTTCMRAEFKSSADYCGVVSREIQNRLGGFSIFFNGACGNINLELGERSFEKADFYGKQIAEPLIQALPKIDTHDSGRLSSALTRIEFPLTTKRREMVVADDLNEIQSYFIELEKRTIAPDEYDLIWPEYQRLRTSWWKHKLRDEFGGQEFETVPVHALRIFDHLILAIPGELFVEYQFELQRAYPEHRALIFGYSNGFVGYIADPESFELDSYETKPSYVHRAGKFAGAQIIENGKRLLKQLIH